MMSPSLNSDCDRCLVGMDPVNQRRARALTRARPAHEHERGEHIEERGQCVEIEACSLTIVDEARRDLAIELPALLVAEDLRA